MKQKRVTVTIVGAAQRKVTRWSGGTTEELFIYPSSASYVKRNFDARVSIATIEVDTSEFTPLASVQRTTLILDGEIELLHEGHYVKTLKQLEQDSYDGGWNTTSKGVCRDFNLMTRGNTTGKVEVHQLENEEQVICPSTPILVLYVNKGSIAIALRKDGYMAEEGDCVLIEDSDGFVVAKAMDETELIVTSIKKPIL